MLSKAATIVDEVFGSFETQLNVLSLHMFEDQGEITESTVRVVVA